MRLAGVAARGSSNLTRLKAITSYDHYPVNMESIVSVSSPPLEEEAAEATQYLASYLNRTLHLHTTDGRMFVGQMKCTDRDRNIILAMTHEYRQPSKSDVKLAAERHERTRLAGNVKVDMKKRFVGLVVVPGEYVTKIEVEG